MRYLYPTLMNLPSSPEFTAPALLALRTEADALRLITARLGVKQMGPADHIRTKHEVKAFLAEGGDLTAAEELLKRARVRRELQQTQGEAQRQSERQGERLGQ